jgi:hypothetical protein
MRALQEGLLEGAVAYQPSQEKIGAAPLDGYVANPSGLLEVGQYWYMRPKFLRGVPEGTLFKCLYDGLPHLPRRDYVVVFMRRDPQEIAASCARVDQHLRQMGVKENTEKNFPFDCFRPYDQEDIDHVIGIMQARSDVRLIQVQFAEMVSDPLRIFRDLAEYIPLNPEKSASTVIPSYYRFRNGSSSESRDEGPRPDGKDSPDLQDKRSGCREDNRQSRAL